MDEGGGVVTELAMRVLASRWRSRGAGDVYAEEEEEEKEQEERYIGLGGRYGCRRKALGQGRVEWQSVEDDL